MRIGDCLYFAPGLTFKDLDLTGDRLPRQLEERIMGFYVRPAIACAERREAFAAGVVLVSCIDALARMSQGVPVVTRNDFEAFVRANLPSLGAAGLARRFYKDVRCGLVHEGRLKQGAQFSLEFGQPIQLLEDLLIVNPLSLAGEVESALGQFVERLATSREELERVVVALRRDYAKDFLASGRMDAGIGAAEQDSVR